MTYGELWCVYIVKRGYIRVPGMRLALSRLHCILQEHLCVNEGSQPQQHSWNSKALFFPAQIYCCTIVSIFNILRRLKVKVAPLPFPLPHRHWGCTFFSSTLNHAHIERTATVGLQAKTALAMHVCPPETRTFSFYNLMISSI